MIYGYARVSTIKQARNGNSLSDQVEQLKKAGAVAIFQDSFSGSRMDRPELTKLLKRVQSGDVLIVTRLDRIARTAAEGAALIQKLVNAGIEVNILNMGKADSSAMGKLMVTIMLAFAEFERDMIIERTQTGKNIARLKGIRVDGRPKKFGKEQINHAIKLIEDGNSYTHTAKLTGISKSTLIRAMRVHRAGKE